MSMNFPLRMSDQLKPHLRALRKSLGLTQSQLGVLVGVKQARIAEIEANPGAVSLDQLTKVLAALGCTLHLHGADSAGTESPGVSAAGPKAPPAKPTSVAERTRKPPQPTGGKINGPSAKRLGLTVATKTAAGTSIVIRPKKGAW